MNGYVTAKEAAKKIGINYSTLVARVRNGKCRGKKFGWALFIHKTEIQKQKTAGKK